MRHRRNLTKRVRIAQAGVLFFAAGAAAWHWNSSTAALLLFAWLPTTYALATAISGRRRLIEQLSALPLFFAVSQVQPYESPFGWRRMFGFDESLTDTWIEIKDDEPTYIRLGTSRPFSSDQLFDRQFDFHFGIPETVLELPPSGIRELKDWCRRYHEARANFDAAFAVSWLAVTLISATATLEEDLFALSVACAVVAVVGSTPGVRIRDRTEDCTFLSPQHYHLYIYYPGNAATPEHWFCVCGAARRR